MTGSQKPNEHAKALAAATTADIKAHAETIANFKEATFDTAEALQTE